jgi:hypothetical protein
MFGAAPPGNGYPGGGVGGGPGQMFGAPSMNSHRGGGGPGQIFGAPPVSSRPGGGAAPMPSGRRGLTSGGGASQISFG